MAKTTQTRDLFRSSETGKFVKETFAVSHPKTTEHERVKVPQQPAKAGKKQ